MKRSVFISLITILLLFGFTNQTFSQKMRKGDGQKFKEELNLTDAQEKQLNDLRYEHQLAVLDLRNEIEKNRLEIRNMMQNNELNENRFKELSAANTKLQSKIKDMRTEHWLAVYKILDDNQKKIWTEDFGRMGRGKRGMMRENFGPGMNRQGMIPGCDNPQGRGFGNKF